MRLVPGYGYIRRQAGEPGGVAQVSGIGGIRRHKHGTPDSTDRSAFLADHRVAELLNGDHFG